MNARLRNASDAPVVGFSGEHDFLGELQSGFRSQHGSAAASLKQSAAVRLNSSSWFSLNPALTLMPRSLIWKGRSASHAVLHPNEAESSVNRGEHVCEGRDRCYKEAATAQYSLLMTSSDGARSCMLQMWVNSGTSEFKNTLVSMVTGGTLWWRSEHSSDAQFVFGSYKTDL